MSGGQDVAAPVCDSVAAVVAAEGAVAKWRATAEGATAERADLEARAGGLALADESSAVELGERLGRLQAAERVAVAAVAAAEAALEWALRDALRARAGGLTDRAAALTAVADERQVETDRLVAELVEWEGCGFVPFEPDRRSVAQGDVRSWSVPRTVAVRGNADRFAGVARQLRVEAESAAVGRLRQRLAEPAPGLVFGEPGFERGADERGAADRVGV